MVKMWKEIFGSIFKIIQFPVDGKIFLEIFGM